MNKVAVISRHSVANYGSLMQAYALQRTLENLNMEAVNINYTPLQERGVNLSFTAASNSRWGKNAVTRALFYAYQLPSFSYTFAKFKQFRKQYLKETKEYTSENDLKQDIPKADIFCTGSDQVWNVLYDNKVDDTYFLNFLSDEHRRFSFAASFGGNCFADLDVDKYRAMLEKYESLSVREESGVEILKDMELEGKQVLDPTLLLDRSEWKKLASGRKKKKPYVLIYQLRPNQEFDAYAQRFAKNKGLELYRMSVMMFQATKCGKFIYLPHPDKFLQLIKDTEYFLTDSFHGTCFAINFGVKFVAILPGRFNARNQSLLNLFGLGDRILTDCNDFELPDRAIDWEYVEEVLVKQRERSIEYLRLALR